MAYTCKVCNKRAYSDYCAAHKQRKPILSRSKPLKTSKTVSKPSKPRKPSKTLLTKKLEALVKEYVKIRDDYTCQHCGKKVTGVNCHASHVIPVSRSGYLRCEPLNMKAMCYHCHINWWHKHPIEAGAWFTDKFPERWEYLKELHKQRLKPPREEELLQKIAYYKTEVAKLKLEKVL